MGRKQDEQRAAAMKENARLAQDALDADYAFTMSVAKLRAEIDAGFIRARNAARATYIDSPTLENKCLYDEAQASLVQHQQSRQALVMARGVGPWWEIDIDGRKYRKRGRNRSDAIYAALITDQVKIYRADYVEAREELFKPVLIGCQRVEKPKAMSIAAFERFDDA